MAIQVAARTSRSTTRPRAGTRPGDDVAARRSARGPALGHAPGASCVVEEVFGQVVRLSGSLDVHTVPDVRAALHAALDAGSGDLVAHLAGAVVADATGLGVLLGAHRRAQRLGRRLVLDDVPLSLLRLLRVTRLHRVLVLAGTDAPGADDDRAAAQKSLPAPSSMPRSAS
jgi:anti-anti-sigma factor